MYTQNVSIPPDYFGDWRSTASSQPENGIDWREDSESCSKGKKYHKLCLVKFYE